MRSVRVGVYPSTAMCPLDLTAARPCMRSSLALSSIRARRVNSMVIVTMPPTMT